MTFFFEISKPFQRRPGYFRSPIMRRAWWLWFAVAWTPLDLKTYKERDTEWRYR
jgi:hypothetical protein